MVVLGHAKLLSGTAWPGFPFNLADAAVDWFFVVSGFLITGSYERCHGLLAFYVRRIFRLYPMYLFIVLAQTAIMLALLPEGRSANRRRRCVTSRPTRCWRISCNTTSAACCPDCAIPASTPACGH